MPHVVVVGSSLDTGQHSNIHAIILMSVLAEYVKEAVQEDQAGNYQKAFELYKIALDYFSTHLKYEKNPRSKAAIQEKVRHAVNAPYTRPIPFTPIPYTTL